jgi:hypothetical protein
MVEINGCSMHHRKDFGIQGRGEKSMPRCETCSLHCTYRRCIFSKKIGEKLGEVLTAVLSVVNFVIMLSVRKYLVFYAESCGSLHETLLYHTDVR